MNTDYTVNQEVLLIYDIPAHQRTANEKLLLERHFNDLYTVFLHKLTEIALRPGVSKEDTSRLKTFFDELLKARAALGR
ncbi:MAG: hypothetical protein A2855_00650 [Candidatus Liptonbacteria bacterium RIFCSPHIGHO2_01_FULL_57_28]|uniref:Uncharacterized protein n=1 Tax=Candidatus Liptonbacteria bacterium RIFCSPHIGHO2_01_FULL_57_28 TaxID=1798647 RepID=A0A1G2CEC5_9BACT|nr:MAG: hypothetical protein A2855_00650 [Candidatus Liptonbacteria bacterium RIFCSPHIGHO2_01_FULL_57_28]